MQKTKVDVDELTDEARGRVLILPGHVQRDLQGVNRVITVLPAL
jgi:hypothetical protein